MARLSKADWNKLKQATGAYKGTLQRGVKWTISKDRKSWTRKAKALEDKGEGNAI